MAAELFSVLGLQHGDVRAVELVQARIGVDVDLLQLDAEAPQGFLAGLHLVEFQSIGPIKVVE